MVKIFVGNLSVEATSEELKALFEEYGTVTECAIIKNYAFVHMEDRKAATKAIKNLRHYMLHGTPMNVEASHGKSQGPVKLHIANVEKGCDDELRAMFEEYGTVLECAVVKNFAFIHMPNYDEAMDALKGLDNSEFNGKHIHVQISKSRPRHEERDNYSAPPPDYWSQRYPGDRADLPPPSYSRGRYGPPGYPPPPPPPPPPPRRLHYPERAYDSERYSSVVDYYEKYRVRQYASPYEDQRVSAPPLPVPAPVGRDPYERRPLPPPPPPSYYARDRSPIRRAPAAPIPPPANGYNYERSRVPPGYGRDPYSDRLPPMPPARYAY